jgi:hypothetical protein
VVFQATDDAEVKYVPLTVNKKAAPPATAETGLRVLMVGGFTISESLGEDVP